VSFWTNFIESGTIVGTLPCAVGALRFRELERRHFPFLLLVWTGFANDILSYFMGKYLRTNAPNTDIYFLMEALMVLWMFRRWGLFRNRSVYKALIGLYLVAWILETLVFGSLFAFNVYCHVLFSVVSVLLSIQYINKLILTEQKLGLGNGEFLVCIAFVFYFTARIITEIFWFYGFDVDKAFAARVYLIMTYTNVFVNLIFAAALLRMPAKQRFLHLS
jgi:hypothetical protein